MKPLKNINIFEAERIMPDIKQLDVLRKLVSDFPEVQHLQPPLSPNKLSELTNLFIVNNPEFKSYVKLIAILINNYSWQKVVASIPYNRRILLLPRCMQNNDVCQAKTDELGLLCQMCGGCKLNDFIGNAESLGYHIIVSEGSGAVSVLLNSQQIECVIGVACLESFERTFPHTVKHAIPSIAIPLLNNGCKDTYTDDNWFYETLRVNSETSFLKRVNLINLKESVDDWFTDKYLDKIFTTKDKSTQIARDWLKAGGKRWRPLIMLAVYNLIADAELINDQSIANLGLAIECFHKASLAHDDIADNDYERYGNESLLKKHSLPITLNTGDLLLSYGYNLITESGFDALQIQKLISEAAKAHGELCIGQGEELLWQQKGEMPSVKKVIEIFTSKTAPAFEVSFYFAAIAANSRDNMFTILKTFSTNLGIAYQINDDLNDFNSHEGNNDIVEFRPSLILAILNENNHSLISKYVNSKSTKEILNWAKESGAIDRAKGILGDYKNKAYAALDDLDNVSLKMLLYQLLNKIIN